MRSNADVEFVFFSRYHFEAEFVKTEKVEAVITFISTVALPFCKPDKLMDDRHWRISIIYSCRSCRPVKQFYLDKYEE